MSGYLTKTVTASSATSYTVSFWFKNGNMYASSGSPYLWSCGNGSTNAAGIYFSTGNQLRFYGPSYTSSDLSVGNLRDVNGWYHVVWSVNSGTATAYINGVNQNITNTNVPPLNAHTGNVMGVNTWVGETTPTTYDDSDCKLAHYHFIDGTAYDASTFGSFDSNGVWKPNTSPSVTYGTNGFFLKFENSGSMGTDSSGNGNNFTVNGTITQTVDTPSNFYATFNPLIPQGLAYANGNLSATHNAASWKTAYGTLAMSGTGKYYFESKVSTLGSYQGVGIVDAEQISSSAQMFADNSRGYAYKSTGQLENNNTEPATFSTYTTGDIIMTAVDLNAGAIWYGKNGTWQNSATQSEIEAGTTTNACFTGVSNSYVYLPAVAIYGSGTNQCNFGSGYFGTTAVSSAGSNGNGAIFEYDVPTGYYALNTKNLATYG